MNAYYSMMTGCSVGSSLVLYFGPGFSADLTCLRVEVLVSGGLGISRSMQDRMNTDVSIMSSLTETFTGRLTEALATELSGAVRDIVQNESWYGKVDRSDSICTGLPFVEVFIPGVSGFTVRHHKRPSPAEKTLETAVGTIDRLSRRLLEEWSRGLP